MLPYPNIKPYLIKIGPLEVRWYGLMYLFGFISSYLLVRYRIKKEKLSVELKTIEDIYFYLVLALIIGARIGYVLFYNLPYYLKHPLEVFAIWHGGMSFHGGLLGTILVGYWYIKKHKLDFWFYADLLIPTAPIGLFLGRIGNFINGELYGRVSHVPWAMVFPAGGPLPRHPSQLYEATFEGIVLFIILWKVRTKIKTHGTLTALFLILYGIFRFFIEFFREPDPQLGFIIGPFTMGQILCTAMILAGTILYFYLKKAKR